MISFDSVNFSWEGTEGETGRLIVMIKDVVIPTADDDRQQLEQMIVGHLKDIFNE